MAHQFLDRANIIAVFQQLGSEGMAGKSKGTHLCFGIGCPLFTPLLVLFADALEANKSSVSFLLLSQHIIEVVSSDATPNSRNRLAR